MLDASHPLPVLLERDLVQVGPRDPSRGAGTSRPCLRALRHCDLNPDNNHPENLIVLCRSCHAEVHRQRSATWQTA